MIRLCLIAAIGCAAASALAQPDSAPAGVESARATRGLATSVEVDYAPTLRARAELTPKSAFMVRVSRIDDRRQRIEFVGGVAGDFDLRDFIERDDGQPAADLPPIPVTVVTQLPPGHGTDLFTSEESWFNWRAHYRELMWTTVALWIAVPIAYFVVRRLRRPAPVAPPTPQAPPPTLEDQLRAALANAAVKSLSTVERGRLELLVLRFLGERLGIAVRESSDLAATLAAVRGHGETSALVMALERWLHARGGESAREHAAAALEELRRTRLGNDRPEALTGAPG